jgi:hypothetical protein
MFPSGGASSHLGARCCDDAAQLRFAADEGIACAQPSQLKPDTLDGRAMRQKNWILVALIGGSIGGAILRCGRLSNTEQDEAIARRASEPLVLDRAAVLQISVSLDGGIVADGRAVTIEEVSATLDQLKRRDCRVWVYREGRASEPPAVAIQVLEMATAKDVIVEMSNTSDFSDLLQEQGIVFRDAR